MQTRILVVLGIYERHMPRLGYVVTISNKGRPYPFVHPLCLLLGPALLGLLSTSGVMVHRLSSTGSALGPCNVCKA